MSKVICKFCSKELDGKCLAKDSSVELNKKRTCAKYVEDTKRVEEEEDRKKEAKSIPLYKPTFRYYENMLEGRQHKENLFIKVK